MYNYLESGDYELTVGDILLDAKMLGGLSAYSPEKYIIVGTQVGSERVPLQSCSGRDCELDFTLAIPRNAVMKCLNKLWPSISADGVFTGMRAISVATTYKIRVLDSDAQCSVDSCYTQIKLNVQDSTDDIACLNVHIRGTMRG